MKYLWNLNVDDLEKYYKTVYKIQDELKRKLTDHECEIVFLKVMKTLGKQHSGATELSKEEMWTQLVKANKTILNIDEDGFKIIKKKREK